jgi:hypothetical protein
MEEPALSVYESLLVEGGAARLFARHLERLVDSGMAPERCTEASRRAQMATSAHGRGIAKLRIVVDRSGMRAECLPATPHAPVHLAASGRL